VNSTLGKVIWSDVTRPGMIEIHDFYNLFHLLDIRTTCDGDVKMKMELYLFLPSHSVTPTIILNDGQTDDADEFFVSYSMNF